MRTVIAGVVAAVLLAAGCSAGKATNPPGGSPVPPAAITAPAVATVSSPAETCQALTDMDVLSAAEGFALVGGIVQPGDITPTVNSLESVQSHAADVFQVALGNIITALQSLDTAVTAGTGETVDTSTVQPDANLLAGMCRARGLPIPAVL